MIGTRIKQYEILEKIGEGGMGEVYLAVDTTLDRRVALKFLPAKYSSDPQFKSRFEHEAKAAASLDHQNIITVHEFGEHEGRLFIAMQHIDGQTLQSLIEQHAVNSDDALDIIKQLLHGLSAAHKAGIIHRDLKPANILVTTDQVVKILDFGLAKSDRALVETRTGSTLGTLHYKSPEQTRGEKVDQRSDLFAVGVIAYELITGKNPFDGDYEAAIVYAIAHENPQPLANTESDTDANLTQVITTLLEKNPADRYQSAAEALADLTGSAQHSGRSNRTPAGSSTHPSSRRLTLVRALLALAGAIVVISLLLVMYTNLREEPEPQVTQFEIRANPGLKNLTWPQISPNGKLIAFQATDSTGSHRIYVRPINSLESYPLHGTENTRRPFWSPDSKYLAFFKDDRLYKIPVIGGPTQLICETQGIDGSWGSKDVILFDRHVGDSIRQVPASGGVATGATTINRAIGEHSHSWPWFLPDGDHFLYIAHSKGPANATSDNRTLMVGSLSGGLARTVGKVRSRMEYSPTGHLLFVKDGTLFVQQFDEEQLQLVGDPAPVETDITTFEGIRSNFSISDNGTLAIMTNSAHSDSEQVFIITVNWHLNLDHSAPEE